MPLQRTFFQVENPNRIGIDDGFVVYQMIGESNNVDELPDIPENILSKASEQQQERYKEVRANASKERSELLQAQREKIEDRFDDFYRLMLQASKIRSEALNILDLHNISILKINDDYADDVFREILAIPFRFFGIAYAKYALIKANASRGFIGLWDILQNILALIFIFCLPFAARYMSRKVRTILDNYRLGLLKKRMQTDKISLQVAIWVQRLTPYVPWILYGILLQIIYDQTRETILEEIGIIIPIIGYIIVYNIFRLLVSDTLSSLRNVAGIKRHDTKKLIDSTSKLVGYFFLSSYIILYLTEVTVDEGLLYRHVASMMSILGVVVCAFAAYRWKDYVAPAARASLPEKTGVFLELKCTGKFAIFFCLPTLTLVLGKILVDAIWDRVSEFEVSKNS